MVSLRSIWIQCTFVTCKTHTWHVTALVANSLALLGDCASMGVDTATYVGNLYAECSTNTSLQARRFITILSVFDVSPCGITIKRAGTAPKPDDSVVYQFIGSVWNHAYSHLRCDCKDWRRYSCGCRRCTKGRGGGSEPIYCLRICDRWPHPRLQYVRCLPFLGQKTAAERSATAGARRRCPIHVIGQRRGSK